ncbi:glycosyltransferase family 4 protein [Actinomycetospora cinnamomea]|uniref:Glycosyltransferase involved in cell wall biosynthesis n=1 Tax=Actinomycetospora cinnamomea TaxID=663609 RepID=A0A2U1EW64_9PSEU|nr:glycosyltransferase [Actinomycetospora cinnamomea]PVZ03960.1 glycosyltransferase involved in cell wall biosynthesis [Actinomycetospora cinnamomea]
MKQRLFLRILSYYARQHSFSTGGVNQSRLEWVRSLSEFGIETWLLDAGPGSYRSDLGDSGVSGRSVAHTGASRNTYLPWGLLTFLRSGDLLLLHEGWTASNLLASFAARLRGVPYVVIPHGVYHNQIVQLQRLRRVRAKIEKWILENAMAVHIFFESEKDDVSRIAPGARMIVSATAYEAEPSAVWSGSGGYVGWFGRIDIHHKGLDLLLNALTSLDPSVRPRLRLRGPDHLGDGVRLREMILEMGLTEWVQLEGPFRDVSERDEFIGGARVIVHPARWEAFGRTIVEALSVGAPVAVSSACAIAPTLKAHDAAFIFDTEAELAAVLSLECDISTYARKGREWLARDLTWGRSTSLWLEQLVDISREQARVGPGVA